LPDVRRAVVPTIIEDLDDLGPAVVSDPLVAGRVGTLARRRRTAVTVGWTSLLVGLGLTTLAVATMKQHCGGRVCRVSPSPLQWWGVGSGLAIAAGGLLTAHHLSPDPKAIERTLEPWNLRHPDRPLAMLRNNCLESSDRDCTHGPTMALPPAMLMTAGILSIRGRFDAFNPSIRSGPFRTTAFDRGVIHDSTEHRGKRYEKAYRHESALRLQGLTASAWDVRCRKWRKEAGMYEPGHHVTGQIGPFHIDSRREARHQPTSREEEDTCRLTPVGAGEGEGWRLRFLPEEREPRLERLAETETTLVVRPFRREIQYRNRQHETVGYVFEEAGSPVAVVDLAGWGRLALDPRLSPERQDLLVALSLALILRADADRAPRRMSDSTWPW
jgi:hypothetical protein